jgi:hypothetical protein
MSQILTYHPSELPRWAQCHRYSRTIRQNYHGELNIRDTHVPSVRTSMVSSMWQMLTYHPSELPRWAQCDGCSRTIRQNYHGELNVTDTYHPSELPRWAQCDRCSRTIRPNCHSELNVTVTHPSELPRRAQCDRCSRTIRQNCHSELDVTVTHPSELPRCSHCHGFYIKHLDALQTDNTARERLTGLNEIIYTGLPVNCLYWFHFFSSWIRYIQKRYFAVNT